MEKNFRLLIEYDGTHYHGWQRQIALPTVQETIETALDLMTGRKIRLTGSGRTDAGVHALGQTANFRCDTRLTAETLHKGLNGLLPSDIVIRECREADSKFHARFDARSKTYQYRILNDPVGSAVGRQYHWHIRKTLDLNAMQQAATHLEGTRDFKSFEGAGSPRAHTIRSVYRAEIQKPDDRFIVFEIQANGFLKFMVRNIVGTLVAVGLGRLSSNAVEALLQSRNRKMAGPTAPAHGLFLMNVQY